VKAAGLFYFELWTYVDASGERKGERLAFWERTIDTESDMRIYWTHAQMFEFQLAWVGQGAGNIHPGKKFILRAVWRTPWDTTLTDEYVLDFNLPFGPSTTQPADLTPGTNAPKAGPAGKPERGARRGSRSSRQ
jgi:hypothetical protein